MKQKKTSSQRYKIRQLKRLNMEKLWNKVQYKNSKAKEHIVDGLYSASIEKVSRHNISVNNVFIKKY